MILWHYNGIMTDYKTVKGPNAQIAYRHVTGISDLPPIVFLHGFKSDMGGSKAQWIHDYCVANDREYLRFDCFAHGLSGGDFMDFTIGKAVDDAAFMMGEFLSRPAVIIGSSMGGWVGLRLMETAPDAVAGFIGIAAAPDFTREIRENATTEQQNDLRTNGYITAPSGYDEPYIFTKTLIDDGEKHCLLGRKITANIPVHLLQGKLDDSVAWGKAERINQSLGGMAKITYIDDGDHSLSRAQDLLTLKHAIEKSHLDI